MSIQGNSVVIPTGLTADLMSLPMVPRRGTEGDGTEPQQPGESPEQFDENGVQPTLENCSPQKAFQTVDLLTRSQDRLARNRWAIDLYHRAIDENYPFGRLLYYKQPNQSVWEYKTPPGASGRQNPAAVPNKANDLCNKIVDTIEADPAKPNPRPPTNSESAEEAAELAAEALRQLGSATGIDDSSLWRWSLRNALTAGSSFIEYEDTEDGGGWQPYQILAHPQATDPSQPMTAMDPVSGLALPVVSPILRYVSKDNQFVPTADQADRVWLPSIRANRLRREQVRTFPPTAKAHEARAIVLLKWCTLQEALEMPGWDDVRQMGTSQLLQLASYRTPYPNMLVSPAFIGGIADGASGPSMDEVGSLSPLLQRRMYFLRLYVAPGKHEYPNGLVLDVSGANGGTVLKRETLDYTVELPANRGRVVRCRSLPVVQETPNDDIHGGDPFGWPYEARFAGSSEATATLIAAHLDAINQRLHPHVFIRTNAAIDEDEWSDRSTPILLAPTDQEPTYERFSPLPDVQGPVGMLYQAMDTAASLGETAQGLETSTAVSGVAKQITVQQAKVGLSGVQQRHNSSKVRGWKICLQIMQAKFGTAQLIRFNGEDGSDEERWWTGDDLAGIDDIGMEPGTGSMMTPEGKAQLISFAQSNGWLTPDKAGPIAMSGISRDLGMPADPIEQAIERSVAAFLDGPPQGWVERSTQNQQLQQQYAQAKEAYDAQAQQAQMQGVLPMTPPPAPPQLAPLPSAFPRRPIDTDPRVAGLWVRHLTELMVSPEYDAMPEPWKQDCAQFYAQERNVVAQAQAAQAQAQQGGKGQGSDPNEQTFAQLKQKIDGAVQSTLAAVVAKEVSVQLGLSAPPATPTPPGQPPQDHAA